MALITKPTSLEKGVAQPYVLNTTELFLLVSDAFFKDQNNLQSIEVAYESVGSNQVEFIFFTPNGSANLTANTEFALNSRDEFELKHIALVDKQFGRYVVAASEVPSVENYGILFSAPALQSPIVYPASTPGFTQLGNGGLQSIGGSSLTLSNYITTSDFKLIFKFNAADAITDAFYGALSGTHIGFRLFNNKIETYLGSPRTQSTDILASNTLEVSKVGDLFTWTINSVVVHTESSPGFTAPYNLFIRPQPNGVLREAYLEV